MSLVNPYTDNRMVDVRGLNCVPESKENDQY